MSRSTDILHHCLGAFSTVSYHLHALGDSHAKATKPYDEMLHISPRRRFTQFTKILPW
jgi:hypothetical protein